MSERSILAEARTPEGTRVVLFEDTWLLHVLNPDGGHIELEPHLKDVLDAVESSDHRDPTAGRIASVSSSGTWDLADG